MKVGRILLFLAVASMLFGGCGYAQSSPSDQSNYEDWQPGHLTPEEQREAEGPTHSSPKVEMAPNSDMVTPYAPYRRPYPN